ncbi:hypothetical protein A1Q1_00612 [Trichosporon asahii var. asahii CBS 2479]|uniref:Uncharacterized protein n=1 Tax=Trichosporon asahii var. asahii (strain ATCC 90039 / CBS 2479 / JCM 2466 / KCTC 7840 / NBRC 103889/ NCYC 2677 / UAMH 7654) TaxID=1186058 RepID=J4UFJ5_TRIAS|nr:hypothetical protein A1Q1_00612 [Trichosporon asahii var. asahii CBS 2479]EJT50145.1 hypothetical protein A1Q1_00612 [Trichosporon asahii var. asahii CBS 2479]
MIAATARECTLAGVGAPSESDKLMCLDDDRTVVSMDTISLHNAKATQYGPNENHSEENALREQVVSLAQRLQAAEFSKEDSDLNLEEAVQKNGHLMMKVTQLQEQLQHARNALTSIDRDLHQSNAERDRLRKEFAATGASDEPTSSRAETVRLRDELASTASQKQLLESKLDFLNRDNKHLRSTNAELRAKLQERDVKQPIPTPEQATPPPQQLAPKQQSPEQPLPKQLTPKETTNASQCPSESVPSSSAASDYVECEVKLPSINFRRVLDLSERLDDHRLAFRHSNKWYYAVTERHPLTRPRLVLLREDLQWHVDFMNELTEELSSMFMPTPDHVDKSSELGKLRERASKIADAVSDCTALQKSAVGASPGELSRITAEVQLLSKTEMEELLPVVYRCIHRLRKEKADTSSIGL